MTAAGDSIAARLAKAHKVINIAPDLSIADRRVAGALLAHFNQRSKRCDPGQGRIAGLLGLDRSNVERAISRLKAAGLFVVARQGGGGTRNAYVPNWEEFARRLAQWDEAFRRRRPRTAPRASAGTTPRASAGTTPRASAGTTPRASAGTTPRASAGLTLRRKHFEETLGDGAVENHCAAGSGFDGAMTIVEMRLAAARAEEAHAHSWRAAAESCRGHPDRAAMLGMAMSMAEEMTAAELKEPGGGLRLFQARWREQGEAT